MYGGMLNTTVLQVKVLVTSHSSRMLLLVTMMASSTIIGLIVSKKGERHVWSAANKYHEYNIKVLASQSHNNNIMTTLIIMLVSHHRHYN